MELSYARILQRLNIALKNFNLHTWKWGGKNTVCVIIGSKASGKTHAAHTFMQKHTNSLYFCFDGLTDKIAIALFRELVNTKWNLEITEDNWKGILCEITTTLKGSSPIFVFDGLDSFPGKRQFLSGLSEYFSLKDSPWIFVLFLTRTNKCFSDHLLKLYYLPMEYRKISDVSKAFPGLSNKDILRLCALTGGIPCLLDMYDDRLSFELNFYRFISTDSFYYKSMQMILKDHFRTPETYNELLHSISMGSHRISEIGTTTGYPYNKCDKYLGALKEIGVVRCDENIGYIIPNLYVRFWYKELYGKLQNLPPDKLQKFAESLLLQLDEEYTLPCYRDACLHLWKRKYSLQGVSHKRLKVKLKTGEQFVFDHACKYEGKVYLAKIMDDFDARCDKEYYLKVIAAAEAVYPFYDVELSIFSLNRFSDFCVHAVTQNTNVKLVPIAQLKY